MQGSFAGDRSNRSGLAWGLKKWTAIAVAQVLIAYLATGFGLVWWLAPLFPAAAACFGLSFSRLRSFCEHVPPPGDATSGEAHVRSHRPNLLDGLLIFELNFNLHVEHHLFPAVVSKYLPQVHRELEKQGVFGEENLSPSILHTVRRRLRQASGVRPAVAAEGTGTRSAASAG